MSTAENTTGLILAGGAGRRVDGQDKGLLPFRGEPMVAHVARCLRRQVGKLLISCNRNFAAYAALADAAVADNRRDFQGPLAGLEAAIAHIDTEFLVIAACDTPLLPPDMASRLLQGLTGKTGELNDICYAHDGEQAQYLCAALRTACLPSLHRFLDDGQRAVRHWVQSLDAAEADFSDRAESFRNYNRMQ